MPVLSQNPQRTDSRREHLLQVRQGECDAPIGGGVVGPRDVEEDRAAAAADHRIVVPAEDRDQVVDRVATPKFLVGPERGRRIGRL